MHQSVLHGLEPDAAVDYLERVALRHRQGVVALEVGVGADGRVGDPHCGELHGLVVAVDHLARNPDVVGQGRRHAETHQQDREYDFHFSHQILNASIPAILFAAGHDAKKSRSLSPFGRETGCCRNQTVLRLPHVSAAGRLQKSTPILKVNMPSTLCRGPSV